MPRKCLAAAAIVAATAASASAVVVGVGAEVAASAAADQQQNDDDNPASVTVAHICLPPLLVGTLHPMPGGENGCRGVLNFFAAA